MDHAKLKKLTESLCGIVSCAEVTGSTSTDMRSLLAEHPAADTVLRTADRQTGGRGRQGKSFVSPEGGLYMTLGMRTDAPIADVVNITSCAAAAVVRALEKQGIPCGIKWVNDIYLCGAKLAGILTESVNDYGRMRSEYVMIGVGLNAARNIFPAGVPAITLEDAGYTADTELLCADIVRELLGIRSCGFDFSRYAGEYRSHSIVLGREVTFADRRDGTENFGIAEEIDDRGGLVIRTAGGRITLDSGEISLRIKDKGAMENE